jgi:GNAT acetyltransferase-like protein
MNAGSGITEAANCDVSVALSVDAELTATRIYEINPLHDSRWKSLIDSHERASVFHSTNWLTALKTAYGYDPFVVTTCPPGAELTNGIVFCRVKSWLTGRRLVSLPFSDHCEPLVNNAAELADILLHMKQYVEAGEWKYIEIRPTTCEPGLQTGLTRSITYSLHRLDLCKSAQELFQNFHKNCVQRKIRRAEREKLHYEEGNSEQLLQKFYKLLMITRRRQRLPPQPLSWFRRLVAAFGGDLQIRVATKDDLPIASILTLSHKKSMVYKYGCSDARFHRFGGMALLFWNAINEAKNKGCEHFEMGRSDRRNLGLISFKEHWGAVGTELSYWKYPHNPKAGSSWQERVLHRLVPVIPDSALRSLGEVLYRHVG